ncbi:MULTISPECIES: cupin domain-containing protein [Streptosporangium]|uniref:Mannose-6-phosphate isomerase-like protein (Cupin superfamily) n=1 Tax=Streptosporangium brasiliense TaxID=47480 RepID=A0ABT9RKA4_9ACTN|nr:cupin domain-containing protein [Streptosporangium brasiliense]MDP9869272.1 mannose-6-phosphate isomerase-like protein (cupin superfamily) [Streptosporangium brasiliense]
MEIIDSGRFVPAADGSADYAEHLRVPALSFGTYSIPAGATDGQSPHNEDEIYVVTSGRGSFTSGGQTVEVGPGTTLFVPAREEHRFHDITEDLVTLVFFAPAYTGIPQS